MFSFSISLFFFSFHFCVLFFARRLFVRGTDPSVAALGITPPASLYSPTRDASLTLAEKNDRSAPWLATYYSNADPHPSRTANACPSAPLDDPQSSLAGLVAELDQIADPSVINGVQGLILFLDPSVFYENTLCVFGPDQRAADGDAAPKKALITNLKRPLEELTIEVVWCDMSMGDCVYAAWALEQLCKKESESATAIAAPPSRVNFHRFRGVNHLVSCAPYIFCFHVRTYTNIV